MLSNGKIEDCVVKASESAPWAIYFSSNNFEEHNYKAVDLFGALKALRADLEKKSCKLLCNGSRKNIVVSGMSRQMSGGRMAYLIDGDSFSQGDELVDILEYAPPEEISSISEQESFYETWRRSLIDIKLVKPDKGEFAAARNEPNGWVYRVDGEYDGKTEIPPDAIVGAWKVDEKGSIVGDFILNPNYKNKNA